MTCCQPYRPSSSRPHTYGVRPWSSSAIATKPCRPTACVCEHPCSPSREGGSALILNSAFLILNWTFTFSAKERDPETGLSYFGSRYYSSDLSIWLSVDPMSDKYASLSPYVYCADNPVKLVDPNGEEINPIYDRFGYFLGTDDLGLQGDAIIMDKKDFRQNMSHTEAMSKSTCFDPSQSFAAEIRYWDHYKSLKDRPDYDGYITLDEANEWYRTGDGKPLFADLTKIDLSGFRSLGDSKVGKTYRFNLLLSSGPTDDGLVYGNLTFIRTSNNGVRAFADKYDFDMKNWRNPLNWGRNIETIIGQHVAGEGIPYTIFFYGTTQLRSSIFAH